MPEKSLTSRDWKRKDCRAKCEERRWPAKPYQVKQFLRLVEKYNLTLEELE